MGEERKKREGGGRGDGAHRKSGTTRCERKTVVIENLLAATSRTAHARSINRGDRGSGGFNGLAGKSKRAGRGKRREEEKNEDSIKNRRFKENLYDLRRERYSLILARSLDARYSVRAKRDNDRNFPRHENGRGKKKIQ